MALAIAHAGREHALHGSAVGDDRLSAPVHDIVDEEVDADQTADRVRLAATGIVPDDAVVGEAGIVQRMVADDRLKGSDARDDHLIAALIAIGAVGIDAAEGHLEIRLGDVAVDPDGVPMA